MFVPHPPTLAGSALFLGSAIIRATSGSPGSGGQALTLVVAIIGAVGLIAAALITVAFQRRSEKPDPLAESMYRDVRRDLQHAHAELAADEARIDALEQILRDHRIEVPTHDPP